MFNDIYSVRSLPISPNKVKYTRQSNNFEFQSPSQNSRVRSPTRQQYWRKSVHPQIDDKYARLVRGEKVKWQDYNHQKYVEPVNYESTSHSGKSEVQRMKNDYEERIKTLQSQNMSLREELYYLREALLINFQTKQEKDSK